MVYLAEYPIQGVGLQIKQVSLARKHPPSPWSLGGIYAEKQGGFTVSQLL